MIVYLYVELLACLTQHNRHSLLFQIQQLQEKNPHIQVGIIEKILFYSFIHSFIHLFIHSFIHSLTHSLTHSLIHSCIYSFLHSFVRSFVHSLIHFDRSLVCSFFRSYIASDLHLFILSPIRPLRSFVHIFIL